jgi:hypothetical protein
MFLLQAVIKAEELEKEEGAKAVETASATARASVVSSLKLEQFTREDLLDLVRIMSQGGGRPSFSHVAAPTPRRASLA